MLAKNSAENMLPNILLVDDLKENLYALKKILEVLKVNIDLASSGNEALQKMLEKRYAVIILDVQMPVMNGIEVAKVMQENKDTCHTPIIFVTAINKEDEHVFQGYTAGAVDYIFKPVNPNILRCKVKIFVDLFIIEQQLMKSKLDIENTLNSVTDSVITVDKDCCIQHCNTAALGMLSTELDKIKGITLFQAITIMGDESTEDYKNKILEAGKNFKTFKYPERIRISNAQNKSYFVELSMVPLLNIDNQYMGLVFTIHDITEPQLLNEKLHYQATHDSLTNLPNRFHFIDQLKFSTLNAKQNATKLAVIYIDLDGFKRVNEAIGHRYADELLKQTAERLKSNVNETDLCARLGGGMSLLLCLITVNL